MAVLEIEYVLRLNYHEGQVLRHLLGSMTDLDFAKFGIEEDDRECMREVYNHIPYPEEDE